MTPAFACASRRASTTSRAAIALAAAALLGAAAPAARAADEPALAPPPAKAGDGARYHVHACRQGTRDTRALQRECKDHDLEITVLAADADGGLRVRWVAAGPKDSYPPEVLEQARVLVQTAIASGVPVELAVDPKGEHVTLADPAAFRERLKRFAQGLRNAPMRLPADRVQRISRALAAADDATLQAAAAQPAKPVFAYRAAAPTPGTAFDDTLQIDDGTVPFRADVDRHVAVAATADGHGLAVSTTYTLDGERSKALVAKFLEMERASGHAPDREEQEKMRELQDAPPVVHALTVATLDARGPLPARVTTTVDMSMAHEGDRVETTYAGRP